MSLAYSGVEPQPSLAWQFESSNVDSVTGLAPSSQVSPGPAQLVGSAALVTNAPTSNTAVYFPNSASSYMNLGTTTPVNFGYDTSNLFLEAWVYIPTLQGANMIAMHNTVPSRGREYWGMYADALGILNVILWGVNGGVDQSFGNNKGFMSAQTWNHMSFSVSYDSVNTNYKLTVGINGTVSTATSPTGWTANTFYATGSTSVGGGGVYTTNMYIRDLRVVQGGVVPTTSFTPSAAPFSYALPSYVTGSGSVVFTLLGQFITYPTGKYNKSIYFDNRAATSTGLANCYSSFSVSSAGLTSNSLTASIWIKPYYSFPVTGINQNFLFLTDTQTTYQLGINSGINQSQIFSYISSSPSVTLTNGTNLTSQVWNHFTTVFSNVNQTASNTSVSYYFNGTQVGATSNVARTGISVLSFINLCATGGGYNGGWGELDDLRIYNTALTAAQVQSVYSSQGAPAPSRAMPLPQLAWDFNGTTTDYVSGLVSQSPTQLSGFSTIMVSNAPTSNIAAYFPGNTTFQLTAQGPMNDLNLATTNVFIESLVYMNSLTPTKSTILSRGQLATSTDWWMGVSSSGTFQASVSNTSGVSFTASTVANLTTGSWNYVAFSYVSSTKTLYTWLNGASQGTASLTGTANTYTSFRTYMGGDGGSQLANMYVRDVRVVSGGVVPTSATFTPAAAPWGLAQATYVSNMGTSIYAFPSQTINYSNGKYNQAIVLKNPLNQTAHPNNYVIWTLSPVLGSTTTSYGYSITFWFNPSATNSWTQHMVELAGLNGDGDLRLSILNNKSRVEYNINTSASARTFQGVSSSNNYIVNGWNHFAITLYESVSGTSLCFYLNNVLEGTLTSAWGTLRTFPRLAAGNYPTGQTYPFGYDGLLDDLRIYNTALTAAQVQSIYAQQGVPGRGAVASVKRAPGSTAIYSTKWVNPSYTGAIVRVERASDGTTSDFYVDKSGNFRLSSGVSLSSWLGGAQANVLTWYDQSGAGLNAVKDNTTIYGLAPQLVTDPTGSGQYVIFFPNQNSSNVSYYGFRISPQTTASMMCRFYMPTGKINDANWESLLSTNIDNQGVRFRPLTMTTGDTNDFLNPGGFAIHDGTLKTTSPYLTTTKGSWHTMMASRASGTLSMEYIGQCNDTWFNGGLIQRSFYGYMTDMVTFAAPSDPSAYSAYFASQVSSFTGTPLFTQLSTSATSSAVGAFSLRAVNGSTAKAVAVQAHPVVQWPPVAMTSNTTVVSGQLYGNGTYVTQSANGYVNMGSSTSQAEFRAFDYNTGSYWEENYPLGGSYIANTGVLVNPTQYQTTVSGATAQGNWLQIQLPTAMTLRNYQIVPRSTFEYRCPSTFWIAGSNDGTTWSNVHFQSGITGYVNPVGISFTVPTTSNSVPYSYYRLIVNKTVPLGYNAGNTILNIVSWNLFGDAATYAPNAAQDFYADRLGNLLTAPVTGQSLARWLGGATGYVTTWYDQSGQGKNLVQPTATNQAVVNTATSPCSLIFNGTSTNMYNSNFTFNFGPTFNYTIRAVVNNTVGGCLLYRGINGFGWSGGGIKKWWLGAQNGAEGTTGGYPNHVGYSEGYVYGQTAITSAKSSVTWSSSGFSSVVLYENASSVTVSYSRASPFTDQGTYLYIGAGGASAYYNGNIYEIEIFSTPLSASDVTIMG